MTSSCKVLLISPSFNGRSFWNYDAACKIVGARYPSAPLGLITVAALLPPAWECRLINRNTEELSNADLDWADLIMIGSMLPQRPDAIHLIEMARGRGKPVVVGGPDVTTSPEVYMAADFQVRGEAEGIIDAFIQAWDSGARTGIFEAEKFKVDVTGTPIPRFDLLKKDHYDYIGVQFARGCPFTCEFCDIIELFGRAPRVKTAAQMLAELDALYDQGYRGHLDFVDDNFIGNKKAVKAFLPRLIDWQKRRGYPFRLSTEASVNLADDDELLKMMRAANFFVVFVGIESPDTDTLVSMQKKQNTRRELAGSVHKIYAAGMFVIAGFIVGFDGERGSVAEDMIACIEATSIPMCMIGLLYALPTTQLTRRLAREGRLFPPDDVERSLAAGLGDQCLAGLNFHTERPRRDMLADYRTVVERVYRPAAYFGRVRTLARMLDRPVQDRSANTDKPRRRLLGIPTSDLILLWRLAWRLALRQPLAFWHFSKVFIECARNNPRALDEVGMLGAFYLHLGPFSRYVVSAIDRQIVDLDSGRWRPPQAAPAENPASLIAELV